MGEETYRGISNYEFRRIECRYVRDKISCVRKTGSTKYGAFSISHAQVDRKRTCLANPICRGWFADRYASMFACTCNEIVGIFGPQQLWGS